MSQWMGAVRSPAARTSVDCENAVAAVLDLSCRSSAALKGSYATLSSLTLEDVWPGDALQIRSPSLQMDAVEVIVRSVLIESESSAFDEWKYRIEFANDWADDLAIRLDQHIPSDLAVPRNAGIEVLESVSELKAELLPIGVVEIDARMNPPMGGGFEVRWRDGAFGPGIDSDLVLRSPVRVFQIPRSAAEDRFYIRMYDGATPPRYSRFAAAILVHAHL
jgi:hypothetical protein